MISLFDAFLLGMLDGLNPYSLAAAGLLLSVIIFMRKDRVSRLSFMVPFVAVFTIASLLFLLGGWHNFFLSRSYSIFTRGLSFAGAGILIVTSLFLFMLWSRKYVSGSGACFSVPYYPVFPYRSFTAAALGLVLGSLWALAVHIWPPSSQITVYAMNTVLPQRDPGFLLVLSAYIVFKTTLLFFIAAGGENLFRMLSLPQCSDKFRQIVLILGSAYLGAVGIGLLILLVKRL